VSKAQDLGVVVCEGESEPICRGRPDRGKAAALTKAPGVANEPGKVRQTLKREKTAMWGVRRLKFRSSELYAVSSLGWLKSAHLGYKRGDRGKKHQSTSKSVAFLLIDQDNYWVFVQSRPGTLTGFFTGGPLPPSGVLEAASRRDEYPWRRRHLQQQTEKLIPRKNRKGSSCVPPF